MEKNKLWRILGMVNFGLDVFILFFLIAANWIVIPGLLQVFGRAHPMVLHFPVVFIFLLPIIPWVLSSLSLDKKDSRQFMGHYIILAHFLCAITVLFGLILSIEGGYTGEEVSYHKWGGVILLFLLMVLENSWYWPVMERRKMRLALFIPMVVLVITSHIGAGITHGRDFLTEPILKKKTKKVPLAEAIVFRDVIHPILDQKCMNCHNATKSKGELILKDSTSILNGGEGGPVIIAKDRLESPLLQRLLLDIDHDDHMPPKGKPQLTQEEVLVIREWIKKDNLFDLHFNELEPTDTLAILIEETYHYDDEPVYTMDAANEADIRSLNDDYRLLVPIAEKSPALYARFLSASHFQPEYFAALAKTQEQIVDLHAGYMPVTDEVLLVLENFKNLQVLNLNGTAITDKGLNVLHNLRNLQKLYLAETSVSLEGVQNLLEVNPIKKIYLWDTGVDSSQMVTLRQDHPMTEIVGISNPFGNKIIALNPPQVKPADPFFQTATTVTVNHPIPQVKIHYTTDGSPPDSLTSPLYEQPLDIDGDTEFRFQAFKKGWLSSPVIDRSYYSSKHTPDSIWFVTEPNPRYAGQGPSTLINFKTGEKPHEDKNYLGYREKDAVIGTRFDDPVTLEKVVISGLSKTNSYIFPPSRIDVEVRNKQGKWVKIGTTVPDQPAFEIGYEKYFFTVPLEQKIKTNAIKVTVHPVQNLPNWHPAKGDKGWVFLDEVLFQ